MAGGGCSEGVPRSLLVVLALAVVLLPLWLTCAQPLVTITVNEAGLAQVDYVVPVEGNLSVTVQLLGAPDPSLGVVVVDERGLPLAFSQSDGVVTVATLNCSQVRISYYTQELTSKSGVFWVLSVNSPYQLRVVLPQNATPIDMSIAPSRVYTLGRSLALEYPPGSLRLRYVLLYQPVAPPQAVAPQQPSQPPASRGAAQPQAPAPPLPAELLLLAAAVVLAVLAAAILLAVRKRRARSLEPVELGEEDLAILEALRRAGGAMFQGELQKAVGMPPTSLWRRVKKLEELGYVKVEKRAGRNYVRLL